MGKFLIVIGALTLVIGICFLAAYPTKWLVNYVLCPSALVAVFGGPLGFWKAFCLNLVCGALFKTAGSVK